MKDNILSQLLIKCPFPEVFEDTETVEGCSFPEPRRKIGHIRADYDGWRWYNTVWPCHRVLATQEVCKEIDRVADRGATILQGRGGYGGAPKDVVLCACSNKQLYEIEHAIQKMDPASFIIMLQSNEVHGEGFRQLELGKSEENT